MTAEPSVGLMETAGAMRRRELIKIGAAMMGSTVLPCSALAAEEEEDQEEAEVAEPAGGSAKNAFDNTERVTAPMGDDPLDSEKFRNRQDLKILKPWTPEGDVADLGVPLKGKNIKLGKLMGETATIVMNCSEKVIIRKSAKTGDGRQGLPDL